MSDQSPVEERLKDIKRRTRRKFNAEEKLRIVLEGIKGDYSIAELCRREGIHANQYYTWSKEFLDAGKQCLSGNTKREATSPEVEDLRKENGRNDKACKNLGTIAYQRRDWSAAYRHYAEYLRRTSQPDPDVVTRVYRLKQRLRLTP